MARLLEAFDSIFSPLTLIVSPQTAGLIPEELLRPNVKVIVSEYLPDETTAYVFSGKLPDYLEARP